MVATICRSKSSASTRRFSTRSVGFPAISIRVPRLVEIHRERKSGWYERFTEYVESAEEISTGRQRKCKLDPKTKKLF